MNTAEKFDHFADELDRLGVTKFVSAVIDSGDYLLLWNTSSRLWVDAGYPSSAEDSIPGWVLARSPEYAADLRRTAAAYRRYVAAGCEQKGEGMRWFTAWRECGEPASPQAWQEYLAGAAHGPWMEER